METVMWREYPFGCKERIRTSDLQVMSLTSCQLLHLAISNAGFHGPAYFQATTIPVAQRRGDMSSLRNDQQSCAHVERRCLCKHEKSHVVCTLTIRCESSNGHPTTTQVGHPHCFPYTVQLARVVRYTGLIFSIPWDFRQVNCFYNFFIKLLKDPSPIFYRTPISTQQFISLSAAVIRNTWAVHEKYTRKQPETIEGFWVAEKPNIYIR